MKHPFGQYMYSVLRQLSQEFRQFASRAALASLRTPLPRIALILLALMIMLSLIPLIITLFIALFAFRVFAGLITRGPASPFQENHPPQARPYPARRDRIGYRE
ncbi:hypothetical protein [Undibacterium griseum]|uniref:DUF3742 family protein n=1 Tax=Undibacterium griseum TaxID=2762295 RepID=A0ABR6YKG6_9BURK|nr:hypothetical protein [Undibacterium griseum]MBC3884392.1 hypothetical protein [Undibacterium griseum]